MTPQEISIPQTPLCLSANRVWRSYIGGRLLDRNEGKASPEDTHFPEDWIGSAVRAINPVEHARTDEGLAVVDLGGEPVRLDELLSEFPEYFLGRDHFSLFGAQPEFLVKFIDAAERLHFQCHPSKEFSLERLNSCYGKFEAYYVLDVRPDVPQGEVFVGFQRPPSREALKALIERQDIDAIRDCFDPIPVKSGDVVIVPGGVPHALGAGVLLVEILEPSDWVARFEFKRGEFLLPEKDRFMGRSLDFALDMFDLREKSFEDVRENYFCRPELLCDAKHARRERLIGPSHTDCFQVCKTTWTGRAQRIVNSYCIAIVVKGACRLAGPDGWTQELGLYDRVLIPHGMGQLTLESTDECKLLECYPPTAQVESETLSL
ncbi:class I mannose-6-phosphate isomerase [Cerasicoccus maritimus]|uniref:class I mannose-6-phosphate isomerase n=1 Tax=Cerasicoccus maritimus TaxID=490089 RepID=UPI002852530A|nr:class I mannose-6-phosphate isomerase [Cerasicoccus maritimus]